MKFFEPYDYKTKFWFIEGIKFGLAFERRIKAKNIKISDEEIIDELLDIYGVEDKGSFGHFEKVKSIDYEIEKVEQNNKNG